MNAALDPVLVAAVGDYFVVKNEGVSVTATTRHAWEKPRGEVYLSLDAHDYFEAFGLEEMGEVEYDEIVAGLSPIEARALARALLVLADHAETYPARSWDPDGRPIEEEK